MPKGVYKRRSKLNWRGAVIKFRAGQPLASFLGTANYPSKGGWHHRLKTDPDFRARLEAVPRTAGHGRRGYGSMGAASGVDWDMVFAHLRSGGEMEANFGKPGWPRKGQWMGRMATHPEFAAMVRAARLERPRAWLRIRETDSSGRIPVFVITIRHDLVLAGAPSAISTGYELHERALAEAALADYLAGRKPAIRKRKTGVPQKTGGDWAAALNVLRLGKPITSRLGRNGLPSEHQWNRRLKSDAAFAAAVQDARGVGFEALKRLGVDPPRGPGLKIPEATWARFFAALQEAPSLRSVTTRADMPNEKAVWGRCVAEPDFRARIEATVGWSRRDGRVTQFSHDDYNRALRAVEGGRLATSLGDGDLPSDDAVRKYAKNKPDFLARWTRATYANRARATSLAHSQKRRIEVRASGGDLFRAVERLIPSQWPPEMRDEVRGAMVADILEGIASLDDMPAMLAEYRREHFRSGPDLWRSVSFDAPLRTGDGRSLHDVYGW